MDIYMHMVMIKMVMIDVDRSYVPRTIYELMARMIEISYLSICTFDQSNMWTNRRTEVSDC